MQLLCASLSTALLFLYASDLASAPIYSLTEIGTSTQVIYAFGISENGQVTGAIFGGFTGTGAFLWAGGTLTLLGPGAGIAVNSSGTVVGTNGGQVGLIWQNGRMTAVPDS
jgi:hypothetical protein